jgi:hypothetical protein
MALHRCSTCTTPPPARSSRADRWPAPTPRGVADDITSKYSGGEAWTNNSGGMLSATTGAVDDSKTTPSLNSLLYWDADESRELEDGTSIAKYPGDTLQSCAQCASDNGSKATPVLTTARAVHIVPLCHLFALRRR